MYWAKVYPTPLQDETKLHFLCWTSSKPENLEHTVGCFSHMSHVSISISFSIAQSLSTILGSEQQVTGSEQYCTVEKTFSQSSANGSFRQFGRRT